MKSSPTLLHASFAPNTGSACCCWKCLYERFQIAKLLLFSIFVNNLDFPAKRGTWIYIFIWGMVKSITEANRRLLGAIKYKCSEAEVYDMRMTGVDG